MFFSFCEVRHAPSPPHMRRGIPQSCLTLAGNTLEVRQAKAWCSTLSTPRCAAPRTTEYFSVFARWGMFYPYSTWGEEFLGLAALWSIDNWWLGLWQSLSSKACGSVHCTVYTSRGEAATRRLDLPLPQVYSRVLIYRQTMARIAAASEACSWVCCAIYTSQGEAAAPRLSLPLPQEYSWIKKEIMKQVFVDFEKFLLTLRNGRTCLKKFWRMLKIYANFG